MTGAQNPPPSNFRRLVLCCIKSDFHNQICVGKRLTRSTQSRNKASCTSGNVEEIFKNRSKYAPIFENYQNFAEILADFQQNSTKFDRNFENFHSISWNLQIFGEIFGMPDKSRTKNPGIPGCPPPSWRCGFGGRRRTLPWEGGGKKCIRERKMN